MHARVATTNNGEQLAMFKAQSETLSTYCWILNVGFRIQASKNFWSKESFLSGILR